MPVFLFLDSIPQTLPRSNTYILFFSYSKSFSSLLLLQILVHQGSQGGNLKAGTIQRNLLTCSHGLLSPPSFLLFSFRTARAMQREILSQKTSIYYFMCVTVLLVCVCVYICLCCVYAWRSEESEGSIP